MRYRPSSITLDALYDEPCFSSAARYGYVDGSPPRFPIQILCDFDFHRPTDHGRTTNLRANCWRLLSHLTGDDEKLGFSPNVIIERVHRK